MGIRILSTGSALPKTSLSNDELSEFVETSSEWIIARTGIETRRIAKGETHTELAVRAAETAIERAGIDRQEIGLIVYGTFTPDFIVPCLAATVRHRTGIETAIAFDINAACTGFLTSLIAAKSTMEGMRVKYALVLGGEMLSRVSDWNDRTTCVLFGDAVGAVVLEQSPEQGIIDMRLIGENDTEGSLWAGASYAEGPFTPELPKPYIRMDGKAVYRFSTDAIQRELRAITENNGIALSDIDHIVPHQANLRIIAYAASKLNIPIEKFMINIGKYGNTSAASIPVALDELNSTGRLVRGQNVIMVGFGGGLSSGSILLKW